MVVRDVTKDNLDSRADSIMILKTKIIVNEDGANNDDDDNSEDK